MKTREELEKEILELEKKIKKFKRTEKLLRKNNEIVNSIFAMTAIGMGVVENRIIKKVNEAMLKMFNYDKKEEVLGKSAGIIYPSAAEFEKIGKILYSEMKKGLTAQVDSIFVKKDKSLFYGHLKASCTDHFHPYKRTIITISDISWRKKEEEARIEREKMQGVIEMAGAVCHELNQPLQMVVFEYSQILNLDNFETDIRNTELFDLIKKIKEHVSSISTITKKLMRITRYETRDYIEGKKIIDIDKASSGQDFREIK